MASTFRYREIADHLARAIGDGTWAIGERLPSVRELCAQKNASITTVAAAYRLLEQRGLVESRPQSGHFVRSLAEAVTEPAISRPPSRPSEVGLGQLALMVMRDALDPHLTPFGRAMPDPDLVPTAELDRLVREIGRDHRTGIERYDIPPGLRALRVAVARRATAIGCSVGPDDVVITAGALDALTLALRVTCRAGSTVAIESPLYYGLLQAIERLGLRVVEIPTHPRDGISLEALRETLDEHPIAAVVVTPSFNNPLGSCASDAAKCELVELLARRSIPLIEDDVYGDLAHDGRRPKPAKAFDRAGLVLWCSSLSKTAAPGLRIGWIAAGRWQAEVEHLQFTHAVGCSPLTQAVAAAFLTGGGYERFLRGARRIYGERVTAMADAVAREFPSGTRCTRPGGGYSLWVELPEGVDAQEMYAAALEARIAIAPGTLFSAKLRYRRFIRLSAARWAPVHHGALHILGQLVARFGERSAGHHPRRGTTDQRRVERVPSRRP